MLELLKNFWKEEEGQDLVEYALLLGGIALFLVTAVTGLGTTLGGKYDQVGDEVSKLAPGAAS